MKKKNYNEPSQKELNMFKLGLEEILKDVNNKDEISRLKKEIEHLKTRVEIESIRAEIYNLKMLATKSK